MGWTENLDEELNKQRKEEIKGKLNGKMKKTRQAERKEKLDKELMEKRQEKGKRTVAELEKNLEKKQKEINLDEKRVKNQQVERKRNLQPKQKEKAEEERKKNLEEMTRNIRKDKKRNVGAKLNQKFQKEQDLSTKEREDENGDKRNKGIELFIERVGITGLEQMHLANTRVEKFMWYIAFILACAGIVITSLNVADQYKNPTVVYDRSPAYGTQAPFPNVTVCAPGATNRTELRELLIIPEKIKNQVKRKNLNLNAIIDMVLDFARLEIRALKFDNELYAKAAFRIIDASFPGRMFSGFLQTVPLCEEILSKCYFEGYQFDCCSGARYHLYEGQVCYQLNVSNFCFGTSCGKTRMLS